MTFILGGYFSFRIFLYEDLGEPSLSILRMGADVSFKIYVAAYCSTGHAVAQLFEALRYKPEGRGFDSR